MGKGFGRLRGASATLSGEAHTEGNPKGDNQAGGCQRFRIHGPLSSIG